MPSPPCEAEPLFTCRMCGDCCRGYGGTFVGESEIAAIAAYLGLDPETFRRTCCQRSGNRLVLAQGPHGRCRFWDRVCTIHAVKPAMCRAWPFIEALFKDPANWERMASMCPGMRRGLSHEALLAGVRRELERRRRAEVQAPSQPAGSQSR